MNESKMLERVRKLLATAEHPNTPIHEATLAAETAERMIAKYALDEALLQAGDGGKVKPETREIRIDAPYVTGKATLLMAVGQAHGVKMVLVERTSGEKIGVMVGYPSDLDVTEILFTSLLMQCTSAMLAQHESGRAFRHAFVLSFGQKVGERLAATRAETVAQAGAGTDLVLRDRSRDVDDALRERFPRLVTRRVSMSSGAGVRSGGRAGAAADLHNTGRVSGSRRAVSA